MKKLRDEMLSDLALRNYSERTQQAYLRCYSNLEKHFQRSPEGLEEHEIRAFLVYLSQERMLSASYLKMHVAAIKFLYRVTLNKPDHVQHIPYPKILNTLPQVLTRDEVLAILQQIRSVKCRAIVTTAYAAGMRISEVCALSARGDIDSQRMLIHVRSGKGGKDRCVMLSHHLLVLLREYWKQARPTGWCLFPGKGPDQPIMPCSVRGPSKRQYTRQESPSPLPFTRYDTPLPLTSWNPEPISESFRLCSDTAPSEPPHAIPTSAPLVSLAS